LRVDTSKTIGSLAYDDKGYQVDDEVDSATEFNKQIFMAEIKEKDIITTIGLPGAGKTTFLNAII